MKAILNALEEIYGLFVEDGTLALGILIWLALAIWLFPRLPLGGESRAFLFFIGLCVLLVENVARSAIQHRKAIRAIHT